ncbi:SCO family protein [Citromicrobium bathyomarinum]
MSDRFPELEEEQTPEERAAGLRTFRMIVWLFVALVAGMGLFALFGPDRQPAADQPTGYADTVGGAFSLTAADGSTVTDQTLKGKPFAIFFGFTRCPDVCPTTLASLAKLRKQMGADGDKFRIVFVSVDPGYDSPEDIRRYVDLFGTPIIGLTGSDEEIARVTKAYHAFYKKVPTEGDDYTIDHTASVYLMDAEGKLRSTIDYHEDQKTSLAKLERLVDQT